MTTKDKTIEKLKLIAALDAILRSQESTYEKGLYKWCLPPFISSIDELRKEIRVELKKGRTRDIIVTDDGNKQVIKEFLLTHYLTYICNRQTDSNRVFSVAGYVISRMVASFYEQSFEKEDSFDSWIRKYFIYKQVLKDNKQVSEFYMRVPGEDEKKGKNTFSSRLIHQEAASIYLFLSYLARKEQEEGKDYFFDIFKKNASPKENGLLKIAEELHRHTYFTKKITKDVEIKEFFSLNSKARPKFKKLGATYKFSEHNFSSKRLWCCLRDYFYNTDFSILLEGVIGQSAFDRLKEQTELLELPGDIYNNDPKLAKCIWGNAVKEKQDGTFSSSRFVRKQYNQQKKDFKEKAENDPLKQKEASIGWIPVNYDVSFLYVQNMCRRSHCSECPIIGEAKKRYHEKKIGKAQWNHLCHKKEGTYCIYISVALGIFYKCPGNNRNDPNSQEGYCKIYPIIESLLGENEFEADA